MKCCVRARLLTFVGWLVILLAGSVLLGNSFAAPTSFVTSAIPGRLRSDFNGFVGMQFTVGAEPLTIVSLGRWCVAGNTGVHTLKLVRAADQLDLPNGAVSVSMSAGVPGQFHYADLAVPVILNPGESYVVASEEQFGVDDWCDLDTSLRHRKVATVIGPVYSNIAPSDVLTNNAYGPVDFKFAGPAGFEIVSPADGESIIGSAVSINAESGLDLARIDFYDGNTFLGGLTSPPFIWNWTSVPPGTHWLVAQGTRSNGSTVTSAVVRVETASIHPLDVEKPFVKSFNLSSARPWNHGFAGTRIKVGPTPLVVTALGRRVESDDAASYRLKLVRGNDGLDVPNGSALITGGVPNQVHYQNLDQPVVLGALTDYYLVSHRSGHHEGWLERPAHLITATGAESQGGVYFRDDAPWITDVEPNLSYAAVSFKYLSREIAISNPLDGAGYVAPGSVTITAAPNPGLDRVEFYAGETKLGEVTSPPFQWAWADPPPGAHQLRLIGRGPGPTFLTSAVVNVTIASTNLTGAETAFIQSLTVTDTPVNAPGAVGLHFRVGPQPLIVTSLGRWLAAGSAEEYRLKVVRASDLVDLPGGEVLIGPPVTSPNALNYRTLASPIVLAPSTDYYLLSTHDSGEQSFRAGQMPASFADEADWRGVIVTGESNALISWDGAPVGYVAYGPVDFKFLDLPPRPGVEITSPSDWSSFGGPAVLVQTAVTPSVAAVEFYANTVKVGEDLSAPFQLNWNNVPPGLYALEARARDALGARATSAPVRIFVDLPTIQQPFVVSTVPGVVRNNFGGWVGMYFSLGPQPMVVSALGRFMVEGNTEEHRLRLLRADNHNHTGIQQATELGTVTVQMGNGVPGQFLYAPLAVPVTLVPGTMYVLASEERAGGDLWHELDTVVLPSSAGLIGGAVYGAAQPAWVFGPEPNRSYVPVNLLLVPDRSTPPLTLQVRSFGTQVEMTLSGPAGRRCRIDVSENLIDWVELGTYMLGSGPLPIHDPQTSVANRRFYRPSLLP